MQRGIFFFVVSLLVASDVLAANNFMPKRFNTITSHNDVYPYILNNAKANSTNKTNTSTKTVNTTSGTPVGRRRIVKQVTNARAATNTTTTSQQNTNVGSMRRIVRRPITETTRSATNNNNYSQNVGVRSATNNNRNSQNVNVRSATPVRTRATGTTRVINASNTTSSGRVSSQRCMSDYKTCMEMYCEREDTPYNRCYCSAKLAQIDAKYQNKIDELIQQIVRLQYETATTSDEIKEYWDQTVGVYTKTNPWVNIDNALNIDWADTQSRIRGQNAFNTGHEYCVKNLRACYYMASNLRDAYKSEIARDCETYEKSLQKIQEAAESVIESYKK